MPEAGGSRGAAAVLVAVLLAGPAAQAVPLADAGLPNVVVSYTWDPETGEVTDHSRHGGALPSIACDGGWDRVISSATNALEERWQIQYRFDYGEDWVEVRDVRGSILTIDTFECQGEVSYGPPRPAALDNDAANEEGPGSCDGPERAAVGADAPATTELSTPLSSWNTVTVSCVRARGAGTASSPGEAPFTGRVHVWVEDAQGDTVAEATTCTMLGGSCWSGGEAVPTLEDPADAEATSLHCEAEPFLGLAEVHPAGTFGCEAVFR